MFLFFNSFELLFFFFLNTKQFYNLVLGAITLILRPKIIILFFIKQSILILFGTTNFFSVFCSRIQFVKKESTV